MKTSTGIINNNNNIDNIIMEEYRKQFENFQNYIEDIRRDNANDSIKEINKELKLIKSLKDVEKDKKPILKHYINDLKNYKNQIKQEQKNKNKQLKDENKRLKVELKTLKEQKKITEESINNLLKINKLENTEANRNLKNQKRNF